MSAAAKNDASPAPSPTEPDALVGAGSRMRTHDRQTFVLGIFPGLGSAGDAVRVLSASPARNCDVLLVSDAPERYPPPEAGPCIGRHAADTSCRLGPELRRAIAGSPPFRALWDSIGTPGGIDAESGMLGTQRLFQHLVHRLADGAAVVIVRTASPEQRLATSRTLLEASCEALLTHEVDQLSDGQAE